MVVIVDPVPPEAGTWVTDVLINACAFYLFVTDLCVEP